MHKYLHWLIVPLFFLACARQSSPTGGPKDTIPPKLVHAIPLNESTNFKGQQIELEFSEMIIANNPKEQLIVTPTIGKDFEVKVRKNSLIIDLDKPLEENTTYTLNFRETVQDITEKNPVKNLQLALSTGSYLDSLSVSGNISDLLKNTPSKEITVAIQPENDTFNILKHPATYFTKSDEKGRYKIDHLKPATYTVYAFDDKNRNLIIDSKTEAYGFLSDSIRLTADTSRVSMAIQRLDARPLKLTSARPYNTYFNIRTSKNLKNFTLESPEGRDLFYSYGEDQSNIQIYNSFENTDSVSVNFIAIDSVGNKLDSILYAKFQNREVTPEKFTTSLKSSSIIASKGLLQATITFSKPVKEINFDSLYFEVDSLTLVQISKEDLTYDEPTRTMSVKKLLDKKFFPAPEEGEESAAKKADTSKHILKKKYSLFAAAGTFISVESDSSSALIQPILPQKSADLSQLEFEIKTTHSNLIVQLLDKEFKVLQEKLNLKKGIFQDVPAGEYQMRVIIDTNKNGVWDAGNIIERIEPERIIYSLDDEKKQIIKLKANWEVVLPVMLITS
jgi:uncharacterized protein (DUF2141 family)